MLKFLWLLIILNIDFYLRPVLAFRYCRCLCPSICPSICPSVHPSVTKFVHEITHHPFKLGSPNLDHGCKRPWLRSLLFWGVIDLNLQSQNLPHFELVCATTHHPFKLGPPNLYQRWKIPWFMSLLFWEGIDFELRGQIWLKKSNFLVSPLLKIHDHHITTREPWVPRLLQRPDCFTVSFLCTYLYT